MDTVTILRQLWRLRLLVAGVAVLALVAGYLVAFKPLTLESRKYDVGVATSRIFVDTPDSQVVDVAPKGSDTTGARANLLATLMVDGEIKTAIAKRAGIDPNQLYGVSSTSATPAAAAPPAKRGYVLTTAVLALPAGGWLPIIDVQAQGPDRAAAQRLANAATAGLQDFLNSKAAADEIPNADRLRVGGLGVAQSQEVVRGPRNLFTLAIVLFLFIAGCVAIIAGAGLVRGLRAPEDGPDVLVSSPFDDDPFDPRAADWPRPVRELPPAPSVVDWDEPDDVHEEPAEPASERDDDAEPRDGLAEPAKPRASSVWWGGGPADLQ